MFAVEVILIMVALILVSYVAHIFIKGISIPLIQIGLGAAYAFLPFSIGLEMETETFMLIFVAPILFMDGKKFKNKELLDFKKPILYLVLGLVFVNILIVGYVINLLVGIPLAISFALAAIVSPTDAVAVKAISGGLKLPHSISSIVEGESMLNDASGLVAFNFALVAQMTGVFDIHELALSFLYIALGGLILGVLLAFLLNYLMNKLKDLGANEPNLFTLIQILIPFGVFMIAEALDLSGILAVVACGRTIAILSPKLMTFGEANIRFTAEGTWGTFLFVLNGLVFVLLGMEMPQIFSGVLADGFNIWLCIFYVFIITGLLISLRYLWIYFFIGAKEADRAKNALLMSLSGVRGALTLAVCLSIPFILNDDEIFLERSLLLFISSGIIILSIVIANIFLPLILGKNAKDLHSRDNAVIKIIRASIDTIRRAANEKNKETANLLIAYFEYLLSDISHSKTKKDKIKLKDSSEESLLKVLALGLGSSDNNAELEKLLDMRIVDKCELEFITLSIQKLQIKALLEAGEIDSATAYHIRRDISVEETILFEEEIESME